MFQRISPNPQSDPGGCIFAASGRIYDTIMQKKSLTNLLRIFGEVMKNSTEKLPNKTLSCKIFSINPWKKLVGDIFVEISGGTTEKIPSIFWCEALNYFFMNSRTICVKSYLTNLQGRDYRSSPWIKYLWYHWRNRLKKFLDKFHEGTVK